MHTPLNGVETKKEQSAVIKGFPSCLIGLTSPSHHISDGEQTVIYPLPVKDSQCVDDGNTAAAQVNAAEGGGVTWSGKVGHRIKQVVLI